MHKVLLAVCRLLKAQNKQTVLQQQQMVEVFQSLSLALRVQAACGLQVVADLRGKART